MKEEYQSTFIQNTDNKLEHIKDSIGELWTSIKANTHRSTLLSETAQFHATYLDAMQSLEELSKSDPIVKDSLDKAHLYPDIEILNMMALQKRRALWKIYDISQECALDNNALERKAISLQGHATGLTLVRNIFQ